VTFFRGIKAAAPGDIASASASLGTSAGDIDNVHRNTVGSPALDPWARVRTPPSRRRQRGPRHPARPPHQPSPGGLSFL